MRIKVAILAVSNKRRHDRSHYRYCVAGITENGEWIRLVADEDGDSLPDDIALRRSYVIDADVKYAPLKYQPENAILVNYKRINDEFNNYVKLLRPQAERYIFGNTLNRLNESEMKWANGSLRLVKVQNLEIYKKENGGYKVKFVNKGVFYDNIAMTDPDYYKAKMIGDANIVISLPNDDGGFNGYYKFVAAIYPNLTT